MKKNRRIAKQLVRLAKALVAVDAWSNAFSVPDHDPAIELVNSMQNPLQYQKNLDEIKNAMQAHLQLIDAVMDGSMSLCQQYKNFSNAFNSQLNRLLSPADLPQDPDAFIKSMCDYAGRATDKNAKYADRFRASMIAAVKPLRAFYWLFNVGRNLQELFAICQAHTQNNALDAMAKLLNFKDPKKSKEFIKNLAFNQGNPTDELSDLINGLGYTISDNSPSLEEHGNKALNDQELNFLEESCEKLDQNDPKFRINVLRTILRAAYPELMRNFHFIILKQKKLETGFKNLLMVHYSATNIWQNPSLQGLNERRNELRLIGITPDNPSNEAIVRQRQQITDEIAALAGQNLLDMTGAQIKQAIKKLNDNQVQEIAENLPAVVQEIKQNAAVQPKPSASPASPAPQQPSMSADDVIAMMLGAIPNQPTASRHGGARAMRTAGIGSWLKDLAGRFLDKLKSFFDKKTDEFEKQAAIVVEDAKELEEAYLHMVDSLGEAGFDVSMFPTGPSDAQ